MAVKQLSVFIENRHGTLTEVTEALSAGGIDIRALSLAETPDYGILRLIVSDTEKACEILRATGRTVSVRNLVGIRVSDEPGGLSRACRVLTDNGFDISYMYAFLTKEPGFADVVMRVHNTDEAEKCLTGAGFTLTA